MDKNLKIKTLGSDGRENEKENLKENFNSIDMQEKYLLGQETNGAELTTAQENVLIEIKKAINTCIEKINGNGFANRRISETGHAVLMTIENDWYAITIVKDEKVIYDTADKMRSWEEYDRYYGEGAFVDDLADYILKKMEA